MGGRFKVQKYICISLNFLLFFNDIYKCFREVFTVTLPMLALCSCLATNVIKTEGSAVLCC